jgi:histidinol-phosphate aminotransferase
MSAVKYPYNVNSLSMAEAEKALGKEEEKKAWLDNILVERDRLSLDLSAFGFVERVFPTDSNFLLVRVKDAKRIYSYLQNSGIIVRDRSSAPLCEGCLRITVGTSEENRLLLNALEKYEQDKQINKS